MGEAIAVEKVSKSFHSNRHVTKALKEVTFTISEGEIFGLLGPNGAGKSTLINILTGILKPDSGEARILGHDCVRNPKDAAADINIASGYAGVPPFMNCIEALRYYCYLYGVDCSRDSIEKSIETVGLKDVHDVALEDFSAGMKQKFLLAKALLNNPKIILLDEPTIGLDVESAINVRELILKLRKEGRTILLTTHNMFEAEQLCDRIAFINKGRIAAIGVPDELKGRIVRERIIHIHCSDAQEVFRSLSRIDGAVAIIKSPRSVHVKVDSYDRMNPIMKALGSSKVTVFGIDTPAPTLQETYLKIIKEGPHD